MRTAERREERRVRRGRQPGSQQGQGHGEPRYVPVRQTNLLTSETGRERRRKLLAFRDAETAEYLDWLRHEVTKQAEAEREAA